jgi:lipoyl(octanoyl) transferase
LTDRWLDVVDLGVQPYQETLELQRDLRLARLDGSLPNDTLLLVEHPPVYTLGRGTRTSSLPLPIEVLRAGGAEVVEIERGGDVTWHGRGQLVGYPILNLSQHREDLHWYLRSLEQALIDALGQLGMEAEREAGKTGVWVEGRKIASIGIHVKQWVTLHGFALNVDPDLNWFEAIVPCGIEGVRMTSVARELGAPSSREELDALVRTAVVSSLGHTFALTARTLTTGELPDRLAMSAGSRRP